MGGDSTSIRTGGRPVRRAAILGSRGAFDVGAGPLDPGSGSVVRLCLVLIEDSRARTADRMVGASRGGSGDSRPDQAGDGSAYVIVRPGNRFTVSRVK